MRSWQQSRSPVVALLAVVTLTVGAAGFAVAHEAPSYVFDPTCPRPLANRWKWGGVTALAVAADDTIWVLHRPQDLSDMELIAERSPPVAECCVLPPSMIHLDGAGNVIGSFDAPAGHGMDVDDDGFVYIGQDTVRKYDPRSGEVVAAIARTPEREDGARVGLPAPRTRMPGEGTLRHAEVFMPVAPDDAADAEARQAARRAFRQKYPPETPMVVGGIEEIRIVAADNEIYVADNYLGGRVLVFDLASLEFKRGWGAYGKPLADISIDDADHDYTPNGPMAPDFVGHLTLNVSDDGLVYAADRFGNRIHVTTKQGDFLKEFVLAPGTGGGGSAGGVAFSPDAEQRFLYISDRMNNKIWFLDRQDGEVLGHVGSEGENGGQFFGLHMLATDAAGSIYTGEVDAFRVQRFVPSASAKGELLRRAAELP